MKDGAIAVLLWLFDRLVDLTIALVMLAFVAFLAFLSVGCATAPPARPLPVLPPIVDIGTLVAAPEPFIVPAHVARYPDRRVSRGQCPDLPAGILVSPAVFTERTAWLRDRERLQAETRALEQLRVTERQAATDLAQTCRARGAELAGEVEAARRLAPWRLVGAFLVGVAAGVLFRIGGR